MSRSNICALAMALVVLGDAQARAEDPADPIALRWDAPNECPDAARVREHARRRMGGSAVAAVDVRATVRRQDDATWVLTMSLHTAGGVEEREIRAASCDALAEAAGLLIAVASDPSLASTQVPEPRVEAQEVAGADASNETSEDTTREDTTTEDAIAPPSDRATDPAPPRDPPRRRAAIDGAVRIDAGGQFLRVTPSLAGLRLGGALVLRMRWARAELRAHHILAQRVRYGDPSDTGGSIALTTAGAHGCFAPRWRRLEIPVCAGVELGAMRARSFGVTDNGDAASLFAALPVDASLVWSPIQRIGLVAGAGIAPTVRRPSFHVRGLDPLFVAGPLALRVVAGVEVRFP